MKKLILTAMVVGLVLLGTGNIYAQTPCLPGVKAAPVEVTNPPSSPVPVTGTVATTSPCCYHFVGFSTGVTTGSAGGFTGIDSFCKASFGPSARMCTSPEYLRTRFPVPNPTTVYAWVQPDIVALVYDSSQTQLPWTHVDVSGAVELTQYSFDTVNCEQWTSVGKSTIIYDGLAVLETTGAPGSRQCTEQLPVTCCAP